MGSKKVHHYDNIGKKVNYLTIQDVVQEDKYYYYICKCDCGKETIVTTFSVLNNKTVSCGCMQYIIAGEKNKGHIGANRKPDGTPSFRYLLWTYKRNADKRGVYFGLSDDEFKKLTKGNCFFCGQEPNRAVKYATTKRNPKYKNEYLHNGVDRLNNSKDYTLDNCVSCCRTCNVAKGTQTEEEFTMWINRIFNFQKNKNV